MQTIPARDLGTWKRKGRWRALAFVILVTALPALGYSIGRRAPTTAEGIANAAPPARQPITARLELRPLDAREAFRGSVVADIDTVEIRVSEPAVVTAVLVRGQDLVEPGIVVVELDDRPVIVLTGVFPLLDDLAPGSTNSTVTQLQRNLIDLGLLEAEPTGTFDTQTQRAVLALYERVGYPPPDPVGPEGRSLARLLRDRDPKTGVPLPAAEIVFVRDLPRLVTVTHVEPGDIIEGDQPAIDLMMASPYVVIQLRDSERQLFRTGANVSLEFNNDLTMPGTVRALEEVTDPEDPGSRRLLATVTPSEVLGSDLIGSGARVLVGAADEEPRLLAPATALFAAADGSFYVTKQNANGTFQDIPVTPGVAIGGYVTLEGLTGELTDGDLVIVGKSP